jgi:hypothetical protein
LGWDVKDVLEDITSQPAEKNMLRVIEKMESLKFLHEWSEMLWTEDQ